MQMTLFTAGTTPIGLKTFTAIFEPQLLRILLLAEFNAVRQYVTPRVQRFPDLTVVKESIRDNTPAGIQESERVAFLAAIDKETKVNSSMERFLRFVGREIFDRAFP